MSSKRRSLSSAGRVRARHCPGPLCQRRQSSYACAGGRRSRLGPISRRGELVHRVCAGTNDRSHLLPVYGLRDDGGAVADQVRDLLDRHACFRHQRDERVPQLPRRPAGPDPRAPADAPERAAHVPCQQRSADRRGEHEAVLPEPVPRDAAVQFPLLLLLPERSDAQLGQPQ